MGAISDTRPVDEGLRVKGMFRVNIEEDGRVVGAGDSGGRKTRSPTLGSRTS